MACGRIKIASNKKAALLKQSMREVAVLLAEDPPKEEKARIRAEALIRDDNMIEAYEILELQCELLGERVKLIEYSKTCPQDLVPVVSTIMWASHRVEIKELALVRKQFTAKYGKKFEENAMRNVDGCLNERVVAKLSIEPPAAYLVQTYLEKICEQHEVDWTPSMKMTSVDMVQPMVRCDFAVCLARWLTRRFRQAPPTGASVYVGQGTGLGPVGISPVDEASGDDSLPPPVSSAPSFPNSTKNDPYNSKGFDDSNGNLPPIVPSTLSRGGGSTKPSSVYHEEPDIFVPGPSGADTVQSRLTQDEGDEDEDRDNAPTTGGGGGSYADLAARFDSLKHNEEQ